MHGIPTVSVIDGRTMDFWGFELKNCGGVIHPQWSRACPRARGGRQPVASLQPYPEVTSGRPSPGGSPTTCPANHLLAAGKHMLVGTTNMLPTTTISMSSPPIPCLAQPQSLVRYNPIPLPCATTVPCPHNLAFQAHHNPTTPAPIRPGPAMPVVKVCVRSILHVLHPFSSDSLFVRVCVTLYVVCT